MHSVLSAHDRIRLHALLLKLSPFVIYWIHCGRQGSKLPYPCSLAALFALGSSLANTCILNKYYYFCNQHYLGWIGVIMTQRASSVKASNVPSKVLNNEENDLIFSLIGNGCTVSFFWLNFLSLYLLGILLNSHIGKIRWGELNDIFK